MIKINFIKNGLAGGIVLSFVYLAVIPSINAEQEYKPTEVFDRVLFSSILLFI